MNRRSFLAVLFLILAVGVSTAGADTIRITSGVVAVAAGVEGAAAIAVAGDRGFTFSSTLSRQSSLEVRACGQLLPCGPGDAISLEAGWSGLDMIGGVATLDGVTYPQIASSSSPNAVAFTLTGQAAAPSFAAGDLVAVTAPFTLEGIFWFGEDVQGPTSMVTLSGDGTATLSLLRGTGVMADTWIYQGVRYDFGPAAAPVPEPSSLVLAASGVAFLIRQVRKRRTSR